MTPFDYSGPLASLLSATIQHPQPDAPQPDWTQWARMVSEWAQAVELRFQALEAEVQQLKARLGEREP
jgi:hypothetical protein